MLALVAAVERESEHPLARAVVLAAESRGAAGDESAKIAELQARGRKVAHFGDDLTRRNGARFVSARSVREAQRGVGDLHSAARSRWASSPMSTCSTS